MNVTFKVEFEKTTGEYTTVYLWAYEGWWGKHFIFKSERVPITMAQNVAEKLLKDADEWYKIYQNSPSGYMTRKKGSVQE